MRTSTLKQLLTRGESETAWRLFDGLLDAGQVSNHQLSVMLAYGVSTSSQAEALIKRAEAAGVAPEASTFTNLISKLQVEGRDVDGALAEMSARGIEPDEHTRAELDRGSEELSRIRTSKLKQLLTRGESETAWRLFDGLLDAGQANAYQVRVMRDHGCADNKEWKALLQRVKRAGGSLAKM